MKKIVALLLGILQIMSVAAAEKAITPKEAVWNGSPDGVYRVGVEDLAHLEEGYFTLSLYAEDLYDLEAIESMKPGDQVTVHGETYTVALMLIHGWYDSDADGDADLSCEFVRYLDQDILDSRELTVDGEFKDAPASFELSAYELIMTEDFDGYIVFEPVSATECRSVVNDWTPCQYLDSMEIHLPLPEGFIFLDYSDNEGDAETFLEDLSEDWYSPYNTSAWFENGQLVKVSHSDYPAGPGEE